MNVTKRSFMGLLLGAAGASCTTTKLTHATGGRVMYGLIGKMIAVEGQRDKLSSILLGGLRNMPGNLSYIVANDPAQPDVLWITEVWTDAEAHRASLQLPSVREAIQNGRPLIAGMERVAETAPIGGHGLNG